MHTHTHTYTTSSKDSAASGEERELRDKSSSYVLCPAEWKWGIEADRTQMSGVLLGCVPQCTPQPL